MMFAQPFLHTQLDWSGREQLIKTIQNEHKNQPLKKPSSWADNVHTSIQYGGYKDNIDYFQKAGIPLDLVAELDKIVQTFVSDLGIGDIGRFYIAEMWYNAYSTSQFQHMHKHSNQNNMMFSGVYYMKFNEEEHSATRFYNPYFEVNFDKVRDNPFFVVKPNIRENDVFIFPSDVGHDVEEQISSDIRITIAFNVACIFKQERLQYG
jgi:uncharacterized protein (TIGR02466 family)